jgi:hypothetical protein
MAMSSGWAIAMFADTGKGNERICLSEQHNEFTAETLKKRNPQGGALSASLCAQRNFGVSLADVPA